MSVESQSSLSALADRHCSPCHGEVSALEVPEIQPLSAQVPDWSVENGHHLLRRLAFPDFQSALRFVNQVGAIAEEQGHHPDLLVGWGKVEITIWTHQANGLTPNDFILAAKIDQALAQTDQTPAAE